MTNPSPRERDRIGQEVSEDEVREGMIDLGACKQRHEEGGQENAAHELQPKGHVLNIVSAGPAGKE